MVRITTKWVKIEISQEGLKVLASTLISIILILTGHSPL